MIQLSISYLLRYQIENNKQNKDMPSLIRSIISQPTYSLSNIRIHELDFFFFVVIFPAFVMNNLFQLVQRNKNELYTWTIMHNQCIIISRFHSNTKLHKKYWYAHIEDITLTEKKKTFRKKLRQRNNSLCLSDDNAIKNN